MHRPFDNWRRKAGCVTLTIATACVVMWVRSLSIADHHSTEYGPVKYGRQAMMNVVSWNGVVSLNFERLVGQRMRHVPGKEANKLNPPEYQLRPYGEGLRFRIGAGLLIQDRIDIDFSMGMRHITTEVFDVYLVEAPYWIIVLSLIVLSAYLLLSKSRPAVPEIPN